VRCFSLTTECAPLCAQESDSFSHGNRRGASSRRNYRQFSNPGSKLRHGAGLASRSFSPSPSRHAYRARFAPGQPLPAFQSTRSTSFRHYTISFVLSALPRTLEAATLLRLPPPLSLSLSLSVSLTRRRGVPDIAPRGETSTGVARDETVYVDGCVSELRAELLISLAQAGRFNRRRAEASLIRFAGGTRPREKTRSRKPASIDRFESRDSREDSTWIGIVTSGRIAAITLFADDRRSPKTPPFFLHLSPRARAPPPPRLIIVIPRDSAGG